MKPTINLYLDDMRDCPEGFVIARNADIALYYLEHFDIDILSLDHDLGENYQTGELLPSGQDFVKELCEKSEERGWSVNKVYIHTDNVSGRMAMYQTLNAAKRRGFISGDTQVYHYPFVPNTYSNPLDDHELKSEEVVVPLGFLRERTGINEINATEKESMVLQFKEFSDFALVSMPREKVSLFLR